MFLPKAILSSSSRLGKGILRRRLHTSQPSPRPPSAPCTPRCGPASTPTRCTRTAIIVFARCTRSSSGTCSTSYSRPPNYGLHSAYCGSRSRPYASNCRRASAGWSQPRHAGRGDCQRSVHITNANFTTILVPRLLVYLQHDSISYVFSEMRPGVVRSNRGASARSRGRTRDLVAAAPASCAQQQTAAHEQGCFSSVGCLDAGLVRRLYLSHGAPGAADRMRVGFPSQVSQLVSILTLARLSEARF